MAYKKIFQIFRSTNTWRSKSEAKAIVEVNAKNLHVLYSNEEMLKDGEPIVARYYDKDAGFTFGAYSALASNPYSGTNSASHTWTMGIDEFDAVPSTVDYDSAYYIKVGSTYYHLTISGTAGNNATISSIFGVAYNDGTTLSIEWFDSAADATAALKKLNVVDTMADNTFVNGVHQSNGKIEPLHGTLEGTNAINIRPTGYEWVNSSLEEVPSNYVWDNTNTDVALATASSTSPKFFRVGTAANGYSYYKLHNKGMETQLVINDSNNILRQGAWTLLESEPPSQAWTAGENSFATIDVVPAITSQSPEYIRVGAGTEASPYTYYEKTAAGLSTNMTLRQLSVDELADLGSNVKEAYKLVGTANGVEKPIGTTIKIYKDSSLYNVYLGHADDTLSNPTDPTSVVPGKGPDALCFIYLKADGTYELVPVNIESFLSENEFRDGFELKGGAPHYTDYEGTPSVSDDYWVTSGEGQNSFATREAALASASATASEYARYGSGSTWHYLRLEYGKEVYVKLLNTGGLEFNPVEAEGVNKSIKIKIDETNTFYRKLGSSETTTATKYSKGNLYEWDYNGDKIYTTVASGATPAYTKSGITYTATGNNTTAGTGTFYTGGTMAYDGHTYTSTNVCYSGYYTNTNGDYILDTYLYTDGNGLGVREGLLENKISTEMQNTLIINGERFIRDGNGNLVAEVSGNDTKIAEDSTTIPQVSHQTTQPTGVMAKGIYEYNGVIYIADGTSNVKQYDPTTDVVTVAQALAINSYLAYNLDMGTYTIA